MTITPLPPAPSRTDPTTFSEKADAFVGALSAFGAEANALAASVNADKAATVSSAVSASVSASQASQFATEASQQAFVAQGAANFKGFWDVNTAYSTSDTIVFEGERYVALRNSTGQTPNVANLDWFLLVAGDAEIRTPTPIEPLQGASGVLPAVTLEASPYAPNHSVDARVHRLFQVFLASDTNFTSPVFEEQIDADSTTVDPQLDTNEVYVWRCRDVTEIAGETVNSDFMVAQQFTTADISVNQPTLTVEGAPDDVPEAPELTTSAFDTTPTGEDTHAATDWEVRKTSDNSLVFSSLNDTVNLLSIVVPAGNLEEDTEYKFRARHIGTIYGAGPFAEVVAKTKEAFDIVPLLAVAHTITPNITIYDQKIDTFTKLANPANLPPNTGNGIAFSSDDTYMAVAHATSPFITIYKRSVDTFTKLANPAILPTDAGNGVAFSSDDTYMAVAHTTSPFITIYKRSGDTFTKLADPATLPAGNGRGVAFSSDDTYMAVAHVTSPFITIYKRSGDTFTKLANPATLPTNQGNGVAFSSDDTYMAVAHTTSPFITIYKRSGDTFTKLANPATLPTNNGLGVAFSSDATYMAVAHANSPFITIYKRSGDTFTKLADPATLPAGSGIGVAFSNTGFPQ
jgi:6-phosphogluconolactonase (cycloisomerase 2 family)